MNSNTHNNMKSISLLFIISLFIIGVFGDNVTSVSVSVMEGHSVTLHTDLTDIQMKDVIEWRFGPEGNTVPLGRILDKKLQNIKIDERFTGRLKINDQTGDLTITNIRSTDSGLYQLEITSTETRRNTFSVRVFSGDVTSVSVMEGDSVTLHTDVSDIQSYDVIRWRFQHGDSPLAELNRKTRNISIYHDVHDGIFRDRLQVDVQTGSLIIKNIRMKHSGVYEADFSSRTHTVHRSFTVTVSRGVKSVSVTEGDSVILNTDTDIQTDFRIQWMFMSDDTLIAEIYKPNNIFTTYDGGDERFRDRLKLNDQTGSLTITNIRTEDSGLYELKISGRRRSVHRRISVSVSGAGLSSGIYIAVAVLLVIAAAAVVGVLYYRRKFTKAQRQLDETLKVMEEDSVTLSTGVSDLQSDDQIKWRFAPLDVVIAKTNKGTIMMYNADGRFTDRLKINRQTGDLTIRDTRTSHSGHYILNIISGGKKIVKKYKVTVEDKQTETYEGESVTLKTCVREIKRDDVIQWMFGDEETLIAEINPAEEICRTYGDVDGLFRDVLELNHQTGDLTINDIRKNHTGDYKLKIIREGKTSNRRIKVSVKGLFEEKCVNEGESVTLQAGVTEIKRNDVMKWIGPKNTLIAEINPANNIFWTHDSVKGLFRDVLKLNHQTGDLTINNIRQKHCGDYKLKIISGGKVSNRRINVSVTGILQEKFVREEESVTLHTGVTEIKRDDVMKWIGPKNTLIAEINLANNIFSTYDGGDDGLFRDVLKLNHQTGDLTIKNIRKKHCGVYELKIINGGKVLNSAMIVSVTESNADSVGIEMPLLRGDDHQQ